MRALLLLALLFLNVPKGNCEAPQAPSKATEQIEGTLFLMKDAKGKPESFSIIADIKGKQESSKVTKPKQVLFIKAQNKTYVAYDPREDTHHILLELMEEFHVRFIDDLEGKKIKFEPTTETVKLEETTPLTEKGVASHLSPTKIMPYPIAKITLEEGTITRKARNQLLYTIENLGIIPD